MCLRQAALGIADCALTIVGTYLKSGGLAKISGVSLELASGTLNMEATIAKCHCFDHETLD